MVILCHWYLKRIQQQQQQRRLPILVFCVPPPFQARLGAIVAAITATCVKAASLATTGGWSVHVLVWQMGDIFTIIRFNMSLILINVVAVDVTLKVRPVSIGLSPGPARSAISMSVRSVCPPLLLPNMTGLSDEMRLLFLLLLLSVRLLWLRMQTAWTQL